MRIAQGIYCGLLIAVGLFWIAVFSAAIFTTEAAEPETWTSGEYSIAAEYVGCSVMLRREDGQTVEVPVEKLSQADRERIATRITAKRDITPQLQRYLLVLLRSAELVTKLPDDGIGTDIRFSGSDIYARFRADTKSDNKSDNKSARLDWARADMDQDGISEEKISDQLAAVVIRLADELEMPETPRVRLVAVVDAIRLTGSDSPADLLDSLPKHFAGIYEMQNANAAAIDMTALIAFRLDPEWCCTVSPPHDGDGWSIVVWHDADRFRLIDDGELPVVFVGYDTIDCDLVPPPLPR